MRISAVAFLGFALLAVSLAAKQDKKELHDRFLKEKKAEIASRAQKKGIKLGQNKKQLSDVDPLCNDFCPYAMDGECDDGRPTAQYDICLTGSDCSDCGYVDLNAHCNEGCPFHGDGECDDGRPGAAYAICPLGSDCRDCGYAQFENDPACNDECHYANDGECDDGGANSLYGLCERGTDCSDCGYRMPRGLIDFFHNIGEELGDLFDGDDDDSDSDGFFDDTIFDFDWFKKSETPKAKKEVSPDKRLDVMKKLQEQGALDKQ